MIETKNLRTNAVTTIVIDEVLTPSLDLFLLEHYFCNPVSGGVWRGITLNIRVELSLEHNHLHDGGILIFF